MDEDFHGMERLSSVTPSVQNRPISLQKYGQAEEPPDDDAVFYVSDDKYGILSVGRDYEPVYITHKYTEEEKATLKTYESQNYLPPNSSVYKQWIKRQRPSRLEMDKWVMMGLIGFIVGVIGFLLHIFIEAIADFKWRETERIMTDQKSGVAWIFAVGYSVAICVVSASVVVFWRPSAAGSGIPEVTGYLNGAHVRHIFSLKTMIAKFISCVAAIGCGLPVGPEGPMIHLGALVGAGLSQTKSETLRIRLPFFQRFRNTEDRRNFISAGAAAGVSSAFGAPVGGLLFSMEEVSSFWTTTLTWQIFFCCMVSTFTTDLFNSAFEGFKYTGSFGQFKTNRYILFQIDRGVDVNIVMFVPTLLIGALGGILGAVFTIVNLKMARLRKRILSSTPRLWLKNSMRMVEPIFIVILVTTIALFLPYAFECSQHVCRIDDQIIDGCYNSTTDPLHTEKAVRTYHCVKGAKWQVNSTWYTNSTYNEMASLLFGDLETAVKHLFSRNTHLQFGYASLLTALPYFFFMVNWASGTSVSSGTLVPMLLIGGLYGRMVGLLMVSMFGVHTENSGYWSWIDPGAFALIGAASFFGGVSRLALAVTVIMIELTNDVQVLLPVMVAVMFAKWIGDFFTHPLFHAQLELKCIPFLDPEPKITSTEGKRIQLELFQARDVMSMPVITVRSVERVSTLATLLLTTKHSGFPVIQTFEGMDICHGLITRLELSVLLQKEQLFQEEGQEMTESDLDWVDYQELSADKLENPKQASEIFHRLREDPQYARICINLNPYVNHSAFTVHDQFSLQRTYILFRTLGLRHLTVVDALNRVVGIISRKDLMGFNIEEKLSQIMLQQRTELARVDDGIIEA